MTCNLLSCYFVGNPRPLYMLSQISVVFTAYLALEAVVENQHTPLSTIFDV